MHRYSLLSRNRVSPHRASLLPLEVILLKGLSEIRNAVIAISISELYLTGGTTEK